jgi:hypothetical protein
MSKYTDDEIREMKRVTIKIAAEYLGIAPMAVTLGMRNALLPIGFAVKNEENRYSDSWHYVIVPERLIAYKHGRINEIQVKNIEDSLTTIAKSFEEMKRDLLFLLKENEGSEG